MKYLILSLLLLLSGCAHPGAGWTPGADAPEATWATTRENVQTAAQALAEAGIEGAAEAGDRLMADLTAAETADTEDVFYHLAYLASVNEAAVWLLCDVGLGTWDYDTWTWSPTSNQVYWFDMEVFNLDRMYTETLAGIQSIAGEDVSFTEIVEDTSGVNYEADTGVQSITFLCNGQPCRYDAAFQGDWLDAGFLTYMGQVLDELDCGQRLYLCSDYGQGCILLWQTPEWAAGLKQATGLELTPAADGLYW